MNVRCSGDFALAADFSCTGNFIAIGRMLAPVPALAGAVQSMANGAANPAAQDLPVHSLVANICGLCVLAPGIETALHEALAVRLVLEWRIAFPAAGALSALYLLTRLKAAKNAPGMFELALQLASKPSYIAAMPNAEAVR